MEARPSWDKYFMELAELVSTRGTCDRKRVGAILVKDKRVIATGYNGSIPGLPHCDDLPEFYQCDRCGHKWQADELVNDEQNFGICPDSLCRGNCYLKHGGHDMEEGHCVRTIHAEVNAIADAAKRGVSTSGATCYCNTLPCWSCFKTLVSSGIVRIVYRDPYRAELQHRIHDALVYLNIKLERWSEDE